MAETSKAYPRRLADGFFENIIIGKVIDIGCGRIDAIDGCDPVTPDCVMHDKDICDAHTMDVYEDESYDCVHASHVLEHLEDPAKALFNWYRICKSGGHLVITVPDRDSYERQMHLPSRWNEDHKTMWIFAGRGNSWTHCLLDFVHKVLPHGFIVNYQQHNTCNNMDELTEHGNGEYELEIVIKKI